MISKKNYKNKDRGLKLPVENLLLEYLPFHGLEAHYVLVFPYDYLVFVDFDCRAARSTVAKNNFFHNFTSS